MKSELTITDRPTAVPWPPLLLAGSIALAIGLGRFFPLLWPGMGDLAARTIGLGFGVVGMLIMSWAIWVLHRERTSIMPNQGADKLVTRGPYARFRNPIYLGDALILLGLGELTHNIWFVILSAVFVVLVTWLAILPEERHLMNKFGDKYRDYKSHTRRWI